MIRTGSKQPINTVTPQPETQKTKKVDGALGEIKGAAHTGKGKGVSGGKSPVDPGGVTDLKQIKGKTPLEKLSGKSVEIYAQLKPDMAKKLDQRLASASKSERKDIEDLLHFSRKEAKGLSKQDRVEIRTIVSGYLAHGGGVKGAEVLRDILLGTPAKHRDTLKDVLANHPQKHGADIMSEFMLLGRETKSIQNKLGITMSAADRFRQLEPVLLDFPPDPSKAGKLAFVNSYVSMGFDAKGKLETRTVTTAISDPGVPKSNENLSAKKLASIRDVFVETAKGNYSTQGVALDFVKQFSAENRRRNEAGQSPLKISEAFERYKPNGSDVTRRNGGTGDCMCHAERIVAELKSKGIEGRIVGHYSENLIKMVDPSKMPPPEPKNPGDKKALPESYTIPGQALATENVTHLDVMIPYTNDAGEEHVILISPGIGINDPNAYRDFPLKDLKTNPDICYKRVDVKTGSYDPVVAQKGQFAGRHNLQLLATPIDGDPSVRKLVGIDLLAGTLYLNREAAAQYRDAHGKLLPGQDKGAISVDFKAALSDPNGMTTLRVWDAPSKSYIDQPVTKLRALVAIVTAIQIEFGQPDEFTDNVLTLAVHQSDYKEKLLAPPLVAMHEANEDRLLAAKSRPDDGSPKFERWQQHWNAAAECIAEGDGETAKKHYKAAANLV